MVTASRRNMSSWVISWFPPPCTTQNYRQNYAYYNQRHVRPDYNGYYNGSANPIAATAGAAVDTTGNVVGGALNLGTLGLFNDGNGPISQQNW